MAAPVYVSLEFTPNPNTLKYSVNRRLLEQGAVNFSSAERVGDRSPLATKLFAVTGIAGVMIGRDFVTITKTDGGDWDVVHKGASKVIEEHLTAGEPVVTRIDADEPAGASAMGGETERRIREVLDNEIRPAVAMDGGDITFDRFEDGVVYLQMKGSCAGCPSSTMTLKMGIENRLREMLPEVKEVVSV